MRSGAGLCSSARVLLLPPAFEGASTLAELHKPAPLRTAYLARIDALVPEAGTTIDPSEDAARERRRWIEDRLGATLGTLEPAPRALRFRDGHVLVRDAGEGGELAYVPEAELARRFREHCATLELAAEGLTHHFGPLRDVPSDDGAERVRGPLLLADGFAWSLTHADPASFAVDAGRRATVLRIALLLLALSTLIAGLVAHRSLRRERNLATLKTAFVANVSHELRTPVSSLLLMAENLLQGRVGPEAAERYHRGIEREAQRLRRLVDDVLDFSRLERGESLALRTHELDVPAFAATLEEELTRLVSAREGGELAFRVNGIPATQRADADALRRVACNLVDNALKHSGSRSVEVDLGGGPSGGLEFRVRDRGRGIAPERLDRVFLPFERIEERTDAAGTGLGLAIVREVVKAHEGRVFARAPEDGVGLEVVVQLPPIEPRERGERS